jgi:hypothetical protein
VTNRIKFNAMVLAVMACGLGTAQAQTGVDAPVYQGYTAAFDLNTPWAGTWGQFDASGAVAQSAFVRPQVGITTDPNTGKQIPVLGLGGGQATNGLSDAAGHGDAVAWGGGFEDALNAHGINNINRFSGLHLSESNAQLPQGGKGTADTSWGQGFSVNPNTSVTFEGISLLSALGSYTSPLSLVGSQKFDAAGSFVTLSMADAADRVGTSFTVSLNGQALAAGIGEISGYKLDLATGLMSVTITNHSSVDVLHGDAGFKTFVNVTSPVPEPEAIAMLMLGLGILGAAAKRKKAGATLA